MTADNAFTLRMEAYVGEEWRTIATQGQCGPNATGRMRKIAANAEVPVRLVEEHDGGAE